MIRFVRKYSLFFLVFFISIWVSLASTSLNEQFKFSNLENQVFTLLLYLPFFLLIGWKVISDIFSFCATKFNILYYVFGAYYVALSAYRFLTGGEVKEGIYYAVVLFGAFSLYTLLVDKKLKLSNEELHNNLLAILAYIVLYKIAVTFMEKNVFGDPPINNLYSTSMLTLLLPLMISNLQQQKGFKAKLNNILCCLSLMLILTCSSRGVVMLSAVVLIGLILTFITHLTIIKWLSVSFVSSVLLVSLLAGLNVGKVRFALYREFNISFAVSDNNTTDNDNPTTPKPSTSKPTTTKPSKKPSKPSNQLSNDTQEQINRSDAMRSELMKIGVKEVKKNPLFGTGDLYYTYDLGYKKMEQTAHNFILESLVCFGLVGTLMIFALFLFILIDFGFFTKKGFKNHKQWLIILICCFYYFALGMVQPSVYNTLVCPTFVMVISYHGRLLDPEKANTVKILRLLKFKRGTTDVTDQ